MQVVRAVFLALAALWAADGHAEARPADCDTPESIALGQIMLPAARMAVRAERRLIVLTLGGASTTSAAAGEPSGSYPMQLREDLAALLPGVAVEVVNRSTPAATAAAMARRLPGLLAETGAKLVVWAPGAREAATGIEMEAYAATLKGGIAAVRGAGADLLIMDMQYAPSLTRILNMAPYRDAILGAAAAESVAVVPRYDLMLHWSDSGQMAFDTQDKGERQRVARQLFSCLAAATAGPVAEAVR